MLKVYIIIGLLISVLLFGWFSRGWYEDSKKADALETTIKDSNKQNLVDREIVEESLEEQENVSRVFKDIRALPGGDSNCIISDSRVRLRNEANRAANAAGTD